MSIQLGDEVKDSVTGYKGFATARSLYINGCVRYLVEVLDKNNLNVSELWFDEQRLEVTKPKEKPQKVRRTGGARPAPKMIGH